MAISKVILNDTTLMDVTQDTVTASKLLSGETATGADGESVTGTIATRTSSNMTVSGATITAPAGYYATAASKSVASGSVTQNAPTINSSTGVVTATSTVTAGYVSSGTKSNTLNLTTQAATTITPTTSQQTAVTAGKYTTGAVTVAAIPSQYIVPSGTKTITENGTGIDVTSYASVDVDVASGGGTATPVPCEIFFSGSQTAHTQYIYGFYYANDSSTYPTQLETLTNKTASSPVSGYAIPRGDSSLEYPGMVILFTSYNYAAVYLDTANSSNCVVLYEPARSGSRKYYSVIGCKANARIAVNVEWMN